MSETHEIVILGTDEYARFKRILNFSRHPTFVGRQMYERCAMGGGAFVMRANEIDVAVALVNPHTNVMLVLSVARKFQGCGFGKKFILYLKCNWIRALESACPFFEKMGYVRVGGMKKGRNLITQIMIRGGLLELGERMKSLNLIRGMVDTKRQGIRGMGSVMQAASDLPSTTPPAHQTSDHIGPQDRSQ